MRADSIDYEKSKDYIYCRKNISLKLPKVDIITFANGTRCHIIPTTNIDITRIDWIFNVGNYNTNDGITASLTANCILEGCEGMDSQELALSIEKHGVEIGINVTSAQSDFSIIGTHKNIVNAFVPIQRMFLTPTFPQKELDILKDNYIQGQKYAQRKITTRAQSKLIANLLGTDHHYSNTHRIKNIKASTPNKLQEFYKQFYGSTNCDIIVSGYIDTTLIEELKNVFGTKKWGAQNINKLNTKTLHPTRNRTTILTQNGISQSAIAMGFATIPYEHKDYFALRILSIILGGCSSSRLNRLIREEKGYTYNITSRITAYKELSILSITTQTSANYNEVIELIKKEIHKLTTEPISDKELETVRNIMRGHTMRTFGMPLDCADSYILDLCHGIKNFSRHRQLINFVNKTTPQELLLVAKKYFSNDMKVVVICDKKT